MGGRPQITRDDWLERFVAAHGQTYQYPAEFSPGSKSAKLSILCREHGEFRQECGVHAKGHGCPKCSAARSSQRQKSDSATFVASSRRVHGDRYSYARVVYRGSGKVVAIICGEHGEFSQRPGDHLQGKGCPACGRAAAAAKLRRRRIAPAGQKRCKACGAEKNNTIEEFGANGKGGTRATCKECFGEKRSARWHSLPFDEREKRLAPGRDRSREWQRRNIEKVRLTAREFARLRRRIPKWRVHMAMSGRVASGLKGKKNRVPWQDLVGYSRDDLMAHLERQFVKGMTWQNYGRVWHIDHIVPVASFEFSTPDDDAFRACWAITNLRPLWAADNIKKGARRTHLL